MIPIVLIALLVLAFVAREWYRIHCAYRDTIARQNARMSPEARAFVDARD